MNARSELKRQGNEIAGQIVNPRYIHVTCNLFKKNIFYFKIYYPYSLTIHNNRIYIKPHYELYLATFFSILSIHGKAALNYCKSIYWIFFNPPTLVPSLTGLILLYHKCV